MDELFLNHVISAYKVAGTFNGLYYGFIDSMLDMELKPSKYPAVVIRRIKAKYSNQLIFDGIKARKKTHQRLNLD